MLPQGRAVQGMLRGRDNFNKMGPGNAVTTIHKGRVSVR